MSRGIKIVIFNLNFVPFWGVTNLPSHLVTISNLTVDSLVFFCVYLNFMKTGELNGSNEQQIF